MASPLAILSVINDLSTDQRVDKVSRSLVRLGYRVLLVGRRKKNSLELQPRSYETKRMLLLFERGPIFYLEYQFRLFILLMSYKPKVLVSNDLDTLLPNYLVSRLKKASLVYDSHEYFTEVPELSNHPIKKRIWKTLERAIFPRLNHIFTVNDSIARLYKDEYGKEVQVLRNVPERRDFEGKADRASLGLPEQTPLVILQGAGINIQRGAEEAVEAMKYVDHALLLIVGDGDVIPFLKEKAISDGLENKVRFIPRQSFEKLFQYTCCADLGLTLDKDTNLNYRFSLPNKLFDYIQARVPVLASDLPEIRNIVEKFQIGRIAKNHDPLHLAEVMKAMLVDKNQQQKWKENLNIAATDLCWEQEEKVLSDVYRQFL